MKFKKWRYNLILFGLIAIIGCCVVFPILKIDENISINQGAIEEPLLDFEDEVIPEPEDEQSEDGDETEENLIADMSDIDLINYSINMLYNGAGFSSTYKQTVVNVSDIGISKISVDQNSEGTIKRSSGKSLQEGFFWSNYTGIKSEETKNMYQYFYIEKDNDLFIEGTTKKYNKNDKTYNMNAGTVDKMTYEDGCDKWMLLWGEKYYLTTNKNTCQIYSSEEKDNRRIIKAKYKTSKLNTNIINYYGTTGQLANISYSNYEVTYEISLKTGKMIRIIRNEKLAGIHPSLKVSVSTTSTTIQTFTSVDKEQNIECPK